MLHMVACAQLLSLQCACKQADFDSPSAVGFFVAAVVQWRVYTCTCREWGRWSDLLRILTVQGGVICCSFQGGMICCGF